MSKHVNRWSILLLTVFFSGSTSSSWAWMRVGFRGPRVGVCLGPWPYYWDGYDSYYGPYNAPPYSYAPYDDEPYVVYPEYYEMQVREQVQSPDQSRHDLRRVMNEIRRMRGSIDFALEDGDVSQEQHNAEITRLSDIEKEAHAEARASNGTITGDQEMTLLQEIRQGKHPQDMNPTH
jgi:hypothetical protein